MQSTHPSLIGRDDTMLGVCQGLGEDFGISPAIPRLMFGVLLLWNPIWVFAAYLALGAVVLLSRLIFPNPRPQAPAVEAGAVQANAPVILRAEARADAPAPAEPLAVAA